MDRLVLILLGITVFVGGLTYVLWRILPRVKSVKYFPTALCLLGGLYSIYLAKTVQSGAGFEDLANIILSMMFLTGFVSGLVTGLILDLLPRFRS